MRKDIGTEKLQKRCPALSRRCRAELHGASFLQGQLPTPRREEAKTILNFALLSKKNGEPRDHPGNAQHQQAFLWGGDPDPAGTEIGSERLSPGSFRGCTTSEVCPGVSRFQGLRCNARPPGPLPKADESLEWEKAISSSEPTRIKRSRDAT
uniref:Uncharacterized protein n=1 Tax=Sphaerodactylus townsendi TaxID=933632 RepID=A0ACB8EY73_9SAUR